jgi:hypothetical protein
LVVLAVPVHAEHGGVILQAVPSGSQRGVGQGTNHLTGVQVLGVLESLGKRDRCDVALASCLFQRRRLPLVSTRSPVAECWGASTPSSVGSPPRCGRSGLGPGDPVAELVFHHCRAAR